MATRRSRRISLSKAWDTILDEYQLIQPNLLQESMEGLNQMVRNHLRSIRIARVSCSDTVLAQMYVRAGDATAKERELNDVGELMHHLWAFGEEMVLSTERASARYAEINGASIDAAFQIMGMIQVFAFRFYKVGIRQVIRKFSEDLREAETEIKFYHLAVQSSWDRVEDMRAFQTEFGPIDSSLDSLEDLASRLGTFLRRRREDRNEVRQQRNKNNRQDDQA